MGNPPHLGTSHTPLFWVVLETKYVNFHRIYKVELPQTAHDLGPGHKGHYGIRAISQAQTQDQAKLFGIGTQIINPERQRWSGSSSLCVRELWPAGSSDYERIHRLFGVLTKLIRLYSVTPYHPNVSSGIGLSEVSR